LPPVRFWSSERQSATSSRRTPWSQPRRRKMVLTRRTALRALTTLVRAGGVLGGVHLAGLAPRILAGQPAQDSPAQGPSRLPDIFYLPTPDRVVSAMLRTARVGPQDLVYDLGCGDGRIVIAAAKEFGARGVGIDIDPVRVAEATANARQAGVTDRVRFLVQDFFESDLHEATVVTLYLVTSVNLRLRPKLRSELPPGTRVVSHAFNMGDWEPEQTLDVDGRTIYLWTIPPR
jgi:SAM-dependent methyltransferase